MTNGAVIERARQLVGDRCEVSLHEAGRQVAVRLSAVDLRDVDQIGGELAVALPGEYRRSGEFAAVWFDRRDVSARALHEVEGAPRELSYDEAMFG